MRLPATAADTAADALTPPPAVRGGTWLLLLAVLAAAAAVRVPLLGLYGLEPDELWTVELAMGRGSAHLDLPRGVAVAPPPLLDLSRAAPWWHVWDRLEATHPPLYFVLLRGWMDLFGDGDAADRLFSVAASVAAVGVLFDVVRLLHGPRPAVWAAVLMAVAEPQVDYAREVRNYALLTLAAVLAADAVVRVDRLGVTRRRLAAVAAATCATALTHYFCLGTLVALFAYGTVRTRGRDRARVAAAFVAAAVVYAAVWGPFLWRQRHLFALTDDATLFLRDAAPGHVARTVGRLLLVPAEMLVGPVADARAPVALAAAGVFVAPLALVRRRPDLLPWALWLWVTPGVVLALDLWRQSTHLHYIRYTLLTGPAVYAAAAALTAGRRGWAAHALPAAAAVACLVALPRAFGPPVAVDPHLVRRQFQARVGPDDLVLFVGTGTNRWSAGASYLMVERYFRPLPGRVALLDRPATGPLLADVARRPPALVFTETEDARRFVPGLAATDMVACPGRGLVWTLVRPPRKP